MPPTVNVARHRLGNQTPLFTVRLGVLTVTRPGNLNAIFEAVNLQGVKTVLFAPGFYNSTAAPIAVSPSEGVLEMMALSGESANPVVLSCSLDLSDMTTVSVRNITIRGTGEMPSIRYVNSNPELPLLLSLVDVTIGPSSYGLALDVSTGMVVEAENLKITGHRNTAQPPLLISAGSYSRAVLRTTGTVEIAGCDVAGNSVVVHSGVGEILGNASSWELDGTITLRGKHSPIDPYDTAPGKFMFGPTKFVLVRAGTGTTPLIRFEKDVVGDVDVKPGLAFVSLDSIISVPMSDLTASASIEINDVAEVVGGFVAVVESRLDTDHGITIRIGSYVEDLTQGGTSHGDFTNSGWEINGEILINGVQRGVIPSQ